jgi:hypothetical protein
VAGEVTTPSGSGRGLPLNLAGIDLSGLDVPRVLLLGRAAQATLVLVRPPRQAPAVARVLAGRELAQAVLTLAGPTPAALEAGAALDVLHASSMLVAAWRWPRRRRLALLSFALAGGWAAAGFLLARPVQDPDDSDDSGSYDDW